MRAKYMPSLGIHELGFSTTVFPVTMAAADIPHDREWEIPWGL
jgi:hypothetical protein